MCVCVKERKRVRGYGGVRLHMCFVMIFPNRILEYLCITIHIIVGQQHRLFINTSFELQFGLQMQKFTNF